MGSFVRISEISFSDLCFVTTNYCQSDTLAWIIVIFSTFSLLITGQPLQQIRFLSFTNFVNSFFLILDADHLDFVKTEETNDLDWLTEWDKEAMVNDPLEVPPVSISLYAVFIRL